MSPTWQEAWRLGSRQPTASDGQVPSGAELAEAWTHTLAAAHKALLSASRLDLRCCWGRAILSLFDSFYLCLLNEKHPNKQASKQTQQNTGENEQANRQANKHANKHANNQTNKRSKNNKQQQVNTCNNKQKQAHMYIYIYMYIYICI